MTRSARLVGTAFAAAATLLLAGCAGTVALDPGPDAANPACAEIIVRLPETVDNQQKRDTNAQATAAWGSPASILLRCGVPTPGPSSECVNVGDVDWTVDETGAPNYRFTTYGRTPVTEVIVDSNNASGTGTLLDLAQAIKSIPQDPNKVCTDPKQTL